MLKKLNIVIILLLSPFILKSMYRSSNMLILGQLDKSTSFLNSDNIHYNKLKQNIEQALAHNDLEGKYYLREACKKGYKYLVKLLINEPYNNINEPDKCHNYILEHVSKYPDIVYLLLKSNKLSEEHKNKALSCYCAEINFSFNYNDALNSLESLRILLAYKTDSNYSTLSINPLTYFCAGDEDKTKKTLAWKAANLLLDHEAQPHLKLSEDKLSPINKAYNNNYHELVDLFENYALYKKLLFKYAQENNLDMLKKIMFFIFPEVQDEHGNTILHYAIEHDNDEMVRYILAHTAHLIDMPNNNNITPLELALGSNSIKCQDIIEKLSLD